MDQDYIIMCSAFCDRLIFSRVACRGATDCMCRNFATSSGGICILRILQQFRVAFCLCRDIGAKEMAARPYVQKLLDAGTPRALIAILFLMSYMRDFASRLHRSSRNKNSNTNK